MGILKFSLSYFIFIIVRCSGRPNGRPVSFPPFHITKISEKEVQKSHLTVSKAHGRVALHKCSCPQKGKSWDIIHSQISFFEYTPQCRFKIFFTQNRCLCYAKWLLHLALRFTSLIKFLLLRVAKPSSTQWT